MEEPTTKDRDDLFLHYPLHWLDTLVTSVLNPQRNDLRKLEGTQCRSLLESLAGEEDRLQLLIKSSVFAFNNEREIGLSVKRIHSELVNLLDHCRENRQKAGEISGELSAVFELSLNCLEGLMSLIEARFYRYLDPEEPCPATYLEVTQKEIQKRLETIHSVAPPFRQADPVFVLALKRLTSFAHTTKLPYRLTMRVVLYKKELAAKLEAVSRCECRGDIFSPVDELLVYMNYNSKQYIRLLTGRLSRLLDECTDLARRIDRLLLYYKAFRQLQRHPELVLNPGYHHLDSVVDRWFKEEIGYYKKRTRLPVGPLPLDAAAHTPKIKQKVTCRLSIDQMGLILRAADESRILVAKSMTEVFRSIVPHLSTPYKEELSYDGMRSKSYVAEERDKQLAIEALQKMIRKIEGY